MKNIINYFIGINLNHKQAIVLSLLLILVLILILDLELFLFYVVINLTINNMNESSELKLVEEQKELAIKIDKLSTFMRSDNFETMGSTQQSLLITQYKAMETYSSCLEMRIRAIQIRNTYKESIGGIKLD